MTQERIIEMAKQAKVSIRGHYDETGSTPAELQRFTQLVRNEALAQHEATLRQVLELLGPQAPECCGCRSEWDMAIDVLESALK